MPVTVTQGEKEFSFDTKAHLRHAVVVGQTTKPTVSIPLYELWNASDHKKREASQDDFPDCHHFTCFPCNLPKCWGVAMHSCLDQCLVALPNWSFRFHICRVFFPLFLGKFRFSMTCDSSLRHPGSHLSIHEGRSNSSNSWSLKVCLIIMLYINIILVGDHQHWSKIAGEWILKLRREKDIW